MIRTFMTFAALVLAAGLSQAGQDRPAPKQADVVKELERAFDEARARLQKDDPGAKTRAAHRRIIAGLDELLKQEDGSSSVTPPANPPPPSNAPKGGQQPKPNKEHLPPTPLGVKPAPEARSVPEATPAPAGQGDERTNANVGADGPWDPRRKRQQESLDAVGGERFPRHYEELLRAYYRSLAAGRGEEAP